MIARTPQGPALVRRGLLVGQLLVRNALGGCCRAFNASVLVNGCLDLFYITQGVISLRPIIVHEQGFKSIDIECVSG